MKKFFAYLLALCMVLGMLPATALAEDAEPQTEAPAEQVVNETETDSVIDTEVELKEAVAKGDEVVLGGNIELTETLTIPAGKTVTLDLAGCKVSYTAAAAAASALITNNGTLTISDSSDAKTGAITYTATNPDGSDIPSYATNLINNYGTLTINGGTLTNATNPAGPACYVVDNYAGTLTINGGTLTTGSYAVRQGAYQPSESNNVIITDGTLSGYRAVWVQLPQNKSTLVPDVNLTITGGTLTSTDTNYNSAIYVRTEGMSYAGTDITIGGGTFNGAVALSGGNYAAAGKTENVTITGGTFDCSTDYAPLYSYNESFGGVVSGGTFKKAIDQKYLASGYAYDSATGKVAIDTENLIFEASIDGVGHTTLAEAIAAAQPGDTVTLLKDVTIGELIKIEQAITLDLGGKKVTSTAKKAFEVYANATIKNGTIEGANRCVDTRTAVELTLTDVTLIADKYTSAYGNPQPLTIGGSEHGTKVTITGSIIDAGGSGYGIITFVKTELTATASDIGGYSALYVKPGSENSTFEFVDTDLSGSTGTNDVEGNSFSTVAVQTDNVTVTVDKDSSITAEGTYCSAVSLGYKGDPEVTGNNVSIAGEITGNVLFTSCVDKNTVTVPVATAGRLGAEGFEAGIVAGGSITVYATLAEAVAKATPGQTVTLLKDVTTTAITVIDKAITLDGNGKIMTYDNADEYADARAINVKTQGNVVIKNLTIAATDAERAINVITYPVNLTINNVTATSGNYTVNVAGSAGAAKLTITGSTLNGLCTVNVGSVGAEVAIENSTINCNDNNTTVGESYAALCLNKDAVGGKIIATNTTVNVTEGSDSTKGRNGAENGVVTINGSSEGVTTTVAVITYPSPYYHGFQTLASAIEFAKESDVVTLIRDIELTDALIISGNASLNLNGKNLTGTITLAKDAVLTAPAGLNVITDEANSAVAYVDGAYKVVPAYTITFETDGGSTVESITAAAGASVKAPADPTKTGYTFAGWSPAIPETMPVDGLTVTAQWTINQYTATFNANGGNAVDAQTVDYNTVITLPTPTHNDGYYRFDGWSDGSTTYNAGASYTVTGAVTFTAQWTDTYVPPVYYPDPTPVTPPTTTEKTENEDGSTTTTVTDNKTGTVTETTENVDGSTTTVETQKDGTVTEKVENTDGSTQVTETKSETTTNKDGSTTTTTATKTESTDASGATVTETKTEEKVETETGSVTTSTTEVKSEDKTEVTETKAETTVKEDGTTETKTESTTTATDAAGNVTTSTTTATETTTVTDDGATVTEKVEETKSESAEATVETKTTATTTATEEKTETVAVTEETVTKADGTVETKTTTTTETALADGTTGTAVTDETGKTEATVTISEEAAASEEPVALPIPAVTTTTESEAASTITVTTNSEEDTTVAIPVAEVNTSTVAVIVNEDGTETVITETKMTDEGLVIDVPDGATVKIVDNSTDFHDVEDHHWEEDAVDFASARGLVNGVGNNLFDKDGITTRAHVVTLLARLAGVDTTPDEGEKWYDKGHDWAVENGITYAGNMNGAITRHEMMTLLWRYMGSPESDHDISHFTDIDGLTAVTEPAARWAVEIGLVGGHGNNTMTPTDNVTRGQLAQFMMNFVQKT